MCPTAHQSFSSSLTNKQITLLFLSHGSSFFFFVFDIYSFVSNISHLNIQQILITSSSVDNDMLLDPEQRNILHSHTLESQLIKQKTNTPKNA